MKRKVSFKDANHNRITVEVKIQEGKLSMTGDGAGGSGQIVGRIKPANEAQRELVEIWNNFRLNDMNAGSIRQQNVIKIHEDKYGEVKDYENKCSVLSSYNLKGELLPLAYVEGIKTRINVLKQERKTIIKDIEAIEEGVKDIKSDMWIFYPKHKWFIPELMPKTGEFRIEKMPMDENKMGIFIQYGKHHEVKRAIIKSATIETDQRLGSIERELSETYSNIALYDRHPETGEWFKYGSTWITYPLPEDIEERVNRICEKIERIEKVKKPLDIKQVEKEEGKKIAAIVAHFGVTDVTNVTPNNMDNFLFTIEGTDYYFCTNEEANELAKQKITETLWAFNASFLKDYVPLKEKTIKKLQEELCELFNEELDLMIGENISQFVKDAINADGRGHFISYYDGKETRVEFQNQTYYLYRC